MTGRRVLVSGSALASLAAEALSGAKVDIIGLTRLVGLDASDADLLLIDADACTAAALADAVEALAACPAPPPVLMVGERLPTVVVRNLLRLDRSDVLDAPFNAKQLAGALAGLLSLPAKAVSAPETSAGGAQAAARCSRFPPYSLPPQADRAPRASQSACRLRSPASSSVAGPSVIPA